MMKKMLKKIKRGTLVRIEANGKDFIRSHAMNHSVFLRDASVDIRHATTIPGIHLPSETEVYVVQD